MRILYAHRHDPVFSIGGAEKFVYDLALGLREMPGMEVAAVVNPGDLLQRLGQARIRIYSAPWSRLRTLPILKAFESAVREFRPDVIHSHHRYCTFLLDFFFKHRFPILHTEHVLRKDKKWLFRGGHHATAVSEAVRRNLVEYYGMASARVTVIANAVHLRTPAQEILEEFRRLYRDRKDTVVALCTGRLDEQKGHTFLIRAASLLPEPYRARLKVLLAGDGPLKEKLRQEAKDLGVQSCFVFLGHTESVPELLHLCDLFVLPSLWEGMPLSVLEAYAAGKPVLATDIDGTREIVLHGQTGLLFSPRNPPALEKALRDFMDHPGKYESMRPAIRRQAEMHSFQQMVANYVRVYQNLAKGV